MKQQYGVRACVHACACVCVYACGWSISNIKKIFWTQWDLRNRRLPGTEWHGPNLLHIMRASCLLQIQHPFPLHDWQNRSKYYHYAIPPTSPTCSPDAMFRSPAAILRAVAERLWVVMAIFVDVVVSMEIFVVAAVVMATCGTTAVVVGTSGRSCNQRHELLEFWLMMHWLVKRNHSFIKNQHKYEDNRIQSRDSDCEHCPANTVEIGRVNTHVL